MEVLKEDFSNLEIGTSAESFQKFLDSQKLLFHSQVDHLQRIVVTQCKLTGVNPLSQEMAAGALSIKIGKRPRDLLNPKAIKYMQTMFSIKDALSKKESREISALFGVKVTQVRDFFNSQRSRVRKFVRLSREKYMRSNSLKQLQVGEAATNSDPSIPIDPIPLNSVVSGTLNSVIPMPLNSDAPVPLNLDAPVPLNSIEPSKVDDGPSCSTDDSDLSGIDGIDKQFVQTIFSLMRKEETFCGQVKLMESILQIQNSSVLCWFLTKGGAIILATWLSQAAAEEQTSFLHVILEVLCHLPLHKALPVHISAILQSVNTLRFYRTSDISNRARFLLSRWSKLLTRTQTLKKPNGMKPFSNLQTDIILKQSIDEIMCDESWQSNIDLSENGISPHVNLENKRKLESQQTLKLLPASSDDLNRKHILGLSSTRIRERRQVQLVEQPGQKIAGRNSQVPRASPVSRGRPMSTDDIQKAKMRAQFMQSKHGKTGSANGNVDMKSEGVRKPLSLASNAIPSASKISIRPKVEEHKKAMVLSSNISNKVETSVDPKTEMEFKEESLGEKSKRLQIRWRKPPVIKLNDLWRVGAGANSKEVEVQKTRNSREKEIFYQTIQEIPSNPKEPWDLEMDYDDSLTPEILAEQLPETESPEAEVRNHAADGAVPSEPTSSRDANSNAAAEPDLELLAVLLKNPELVFALTSGQAGNLPSEETIKLLDMIKTGGANVMGGANGLCQPVEKIEVSLPSPTPSSDVGTSGWKPAAAKNPFSQRDSIASPPAATSSITMARIPQLSLPQFNGLQSLHTHHQTVQLPNSIRNLPITNHQTLKPVSFVSNTPQRSQTSFQSPPSPTPMHQRQPYLSEPQHQTRVNISQKSPQPSLGSWRPRQEILPHHNSRANLNNENPLAWSGRNEYGSGRSEYGSGGEFESWSPENSPVRIQEYRGEQKLSEHRMSSGRRSYGVEQQQRQRSPYGYREQNRHGSKRWRDGKY